MHKLIHASKCDTIQRYLQKFYLDEQQINLINKFRTHVGNEMIKN